MNIAENITLDELKKRLESEINIHTEYKEHSSDYYFKFPELFGDALFSYKFRELNKNLLSFLSKDEPDVNKINKVLNDHLNDILKRIIDGELNNSMNHSQNFANNVLNDVYRKYYSNLRGITII